MFYKADQEDLPAGLINSCDVPRSIFWISSMSESGVVNASPWSFSGAIAYKPPQVFFSATGLRRGDKEADTVVNIRNTDEFVVNFPTYDSRELMNATASQVDPEVDEMELAGIEKVESMLVKPPGIDISPIRLECRLYQMVPLLGDNNTLVIGEVLGFHVQDHLMKDGKVDWLAYRPLARMGGPSGYTFVDKVFEMRRPD